MPCIIAGNRNSSLLHVNATRELLIFDLVLGPIVLIRSKNNAGSRI